jgi:hypothetical protein
VAAASRDLFQAPVNSGFLASPVYEATSAAYAPAYLSPAAAGQYTEPRFVQIQGQPPASHNDMLTTTCAVAMCAVIGYGIGRSAKQSRAVPASKPKKPLFRAAPAQPRLGAVAMAESGASPFEGSALARDSDWNLIGTYQWKDSSGNKIFDPLNLASKYDINWLREAELKHGRVTMLATVGFLANDAGLKFPYERFQGISSVDAHDKMVETGDMWTLLFVVGTCELAHASKIISRLDGDWAGWEPGNYGIDPLNWASDATREAELKHSRLAMMAFGGLVTQSALGYSVFG